GRQRVLLLVVVARGHVGADVATGVAEGVVADGGSVGDAVVEGGVVGTALVDEHSRIGHAEGEAAVGGRQRGSVVLGIVVAGGDVEAEVAGRFGGHVVGDGGIVAELVVDALVAADGLAVVDQ